MPRGIVDVLGQIDGGAFYHDLNEQFAALVLACAEHGKSGEMTLKLKIKPNGPNSIALVEDVKFKIPTPTRGVSMFFFATDGSLMREDPRQAKLPLREVASGERQPLREVADPETGELKEVGNG